MTSHFPPMAPLHSSTPRALTAPPHGSSPQLHPTAHFCPRPAARLFGLVVCNTLHNVYPKYPSPQPPPFPPATAPCSGMQQAAAMTSTSPNCLTRPTPPPSPVSCTSRDATGRGHDLYITKQPAGWQVGTCCQCARERRLLVGVGGGSCVSVPVLALALSRSSPLPSFLLHPPARRPPYPPSGHTLAQHLRQRHRRRSRAV